MFPLSSPLPPAPLQLLHFDWLQAAGVEAAILRLDLVDPLISGNKWFKLKHHLAAAERVGARGVISLGGAHSNHLHALAAAGKRFGFATVGLMRGHIVETPTVLDLQAFGMELHWLGYAGYRARHDADFWVPWRERYPHLFPVPEGGGGLDGAEGCAEIVQQARSQLGQLGWKDYDAWWLACGTGTTLAGLMLAEAGQHEVIGAMAVPDGHGVEGNVEDILEAFASKLAPTGPASSLGILNQPLTGLDVGVNRKKLQAYRLLDSSRGGFAKTDSALLDFIARHEAESGIPLEPLYTGKALLALHEEVIAGRIAEGTRLIFLHTGGLQGRRTFESALAHR
ncbi:pyridoxal-phosphate dependent enzyme [Pseudomonas sp. KU26590]|uniref:1-aminocyclopropane-1-carboxylate deaminase/D-cysteine desulfhydrase n=1 Tax=Pseudomonas sp. KU26590 TaxID=2991051 RepID=UPI00223D24A7|nr:pyridoxal-phosphate dependent enzyme [Pseudomonas sp. KU26590]UZJ61967.1 pyridoxal-phosphate dependent enzyme [Pseudomonas sp. KU26590]